MKLEDVSKLLETYGVADVTPRDASLYDTSTRHKSTTSDHAQTYERLEFLGDAVVDLVTAQYLFERYPSENEGFLTNMRTKLVNGGMLADLCTRTGLHAHVLSEGNDGPDVAEDVFEAFLGALFLDQGGDLDAPRRWLVAVYERHVDFADLVQVNTNYKDMLFKRFKQVYNYVPKFYEVAVERKSNQRTHYVVCVKTKEGDVVGKGTGENRKAAEQAAAKSALLRINPTSASPK